MCKGAAVLIGTLSTTFIVFTNVSLVICKIETKGLLTHGVACHLPTLCHRLASCWSRHDSLGWKRAIRLTNAHVLRTIKPTSTPIVVVVTKVIVLLKPTSIVWWLVLLLEATSSAATTPNVLETTLTSS